MNCNRCDILLIWSMAHEKCTLLTGVLKRLTTKKGKMRDKKTDSRIDCACPCVAFTFNIIFRYSFFVHCACFHSSPIFFSFCNLFWYMLFFLSAVLFFTLSTHRKESAGLAHAIISCQCWLKFDLHRLGGLTHDSRKKPSNYTPYDSNFFNFDMLHYSFSHYQRCYSEHERFVWEKMGKHSNSPPPPLNLRISPSSLFSY